jgi:putative phage-type endonuclease
MVAEIVRISKVFDLIQRKRCNSEDEWKQFRRGYLTASDLGAIRGHNPYKSRREVILEKKFNRSQTQTAFMRDGLNREQQIADTFAAQTGLKVSRVDYFLFSDDHKIGASLDRIVTDAQGNLVPLELKTVGDRTFRKSWRSGPPTYVSDQLWLQSALLGECSYGYVASYNRDTDMHKCFKVDLREADYASITKIASEFWEDYKRQS